MSNFFEAKEFINKLLNPRTILAIHEEMAKAYKENHLGFSFHLATENLGRLISVAHEADMRGMTEELEYELMMGTGSDLSYVLHHNTLQRFVMNLKI